MNAIITPSRYSQSAATARRSIKQGLLGAAALVVALNAAHGAVISEPFNNPPGGLPSHWSYVIGTNANTSPAIATGGGGVVFQRGPSGGTNSNGTLFYTGSTGHIVNGNMAGALSGQLSLTLSGLSLGDGSSQGVIIGADQLNYNAEGLYIAVFASGSNRGLGIWENPTGNNNPGTQLAFAALGANLTRDVAYTLTFSLANGTATASLIANGAEPTTIASTSATGLGAFSGYFGLRTAFANTNVVTSASDLHLTLTPIPEPGSTALVLSGVGGLLYLRMRRRRVARLG